MGSHTPNHNLFLPGHDDNVEIDDFNDNFTIIDTLLPASSSIIQIVVSDTTPNPAQLPSKYIWLQTGLSPGGTGFTFWLETGS